MTDFDWGALGGTPTNGRAAVVPEVVEDETYAHFDDDHPVAAGEGDGEAEPLTRMSLHPELRLLVDSSLSGDSVDAKNLCTVVGTIKQERYGNGRARNAVTTALGARQSPFRLEVEEVAGDVEGATVNAYSMQLGVGSKLMESGVFADNTRVAISGPLRLERSYDRQFAANQDDAGMPVWETRIDVITVQMVGDDVPDGSWVQLEGEVDGQPLIRVRQIGPGSLVPFASVRLRYRRALRGAFPKSKAVHPINILVPLEVPLDGTVENVSALLRAGNVVRTEGRLSPYAYRRQAKDPRISAALARTEEEIRARGGSEAEIARRIRGARYRMLNAVQIAVGVGYVELRSGSMLPDEDVARLIEERPRTPRRARPGQNGTGRPGENGRAADVEVSEDEVVAQLDRATAVALAGEPADEALHAQAVGANSPALELSGEVDEAEQPAMPLRPRRRSAAPVAEEEDEA